MAKKGVAMGWWIAGLAALLIVVLVVSGTFSAKFQSLWQWMATIGQSGSAAASGTPTAKLPYKPKSPFIGNTPIANPGAIIHDLPLLPIEIWHGAEAILRGVK